MCGIFGYVGKENALPFLFSGLKKLEYRGYDSSGVAFFEKTNIKIIKEVGKVDNLKNKLNFFVQSNCGIAHTRWATHGKPDLINCHPHIAGDFVLVHNGIIENYEELKKQFKNELYSQTDTEIIAKIINKNFKKNDKKFEKNKEKNILKSIMDTQKELKGSWAVALIYKKTPNNIFVFKNESPLSVGASQDFNAICSDITAIDELFEEKNINNFSLFNLKNYEIAMINNDFIEFYNKNLKKIKKNTIKINSKIKNNNQKNFKHYMEKEINEISDSVYLAINEKYDNDLLNAIKNATCFSFIGCGTAYHACLIGKFLFEKFLNKKVSVELASEFRYNHNIFSEGEMVIGVSQSGETADTIAGLKLAKEKKLKAVVITNNENSTITEISDFVISLKTGREIGVAATKSFNSQIAAFINLIAQLCDYVYDKEDFKQKLKKEIEKFSHEELYSGLFDMQKFFFIGRGQDSIIAKEAALKLKEISYVHAEGYAAGELKHGTLSLLDENALVIAIITQSSLVEKTLNAAFESKARDAKTMIISQFDSLKNSADYFFKLEDFDENFMSELSIIPLQYFAYFMSCHKGFDPDKPRNLAKSVTVE